MAVQWRMPGPSGQILVVLGGLRRGRTPSRSELERWVSDPSCWIDLCDMYEAAGGQMDRSSLRRDLFSSSLLFHLEAAFDQGRLTVVGASTHSKPSGASSPPQPTAAPHLPEIVASFPSSPPLNRVQPSSFGVASLSLPWQIAPGAETVLIAYTIRDPMHRIEEALLEVWRKEGAAPIWRKKLSERERTDGAHALKWDGSVDQSADFSHGYLTLAASPYRVILRVAGNGTANPERQQAIVEVKLSRIAVELGPRSVLKEEKDLAVYDQIKGLPAAERVSLYLKSNLFAMEREGRSQRQIYQEMYEDTCYPAYRDLWEDGPRIPIVATVLLKDSQGKEVRAGKALAGSRILWDYFDPSTRSVYRSDKAAAYIEKATRYACDCSYPKGGGNAHCDFGGKRGSRGGGAAVFCGEDGKTDSRFCCTIIPGSARWWSAFSPIDAEGEGHSQARMIFRPSRIGGDRYAVSAYLEMREGELDRESAPKNAPHAKVGEFEIWREITLARHLRKSDALAPLPAVDSYFRDAFIKIDDRTGEGETLTQKEYDAALEEVLKKHFSDDGNRLIRRYARLPESRYVAGSAERPTGPTTWVAAIRSFEEFKEAIRDQEGWSSETLDKKLSKAGVESDGRYYEKANAHVLALAQTLGTYLAREKGITILQFEWVHSMEKKLIKGKVLYGRTLGMAAFHTREQTGLVCFRADAETIAHELGHCLFLPHAPSPEGESMASGIAHGLHDKKDLNCLMSYARNKAGFCGLCILRLRGWNQNLFNEHGPIMGSKAL